MVDRPLAARSAVGLVRAEGLEPSPEVVAQLEAHATGQVMTQDLKAYEQQLLAQHRTRAQAAVTR